MSDVSSACPFPKWTRLTPRLFTAQSAYRCKSPENNIFFLGNGTNMIWIDPDHDLVVVVRWQSQVDGFIKQVLLALNDTNSR
ncbi:MAG: hypothetical protein ACREUU_12570 [Gammaproteobacteria bacterium]